MAIDFCNLAFVSENTLAQDATLSNLTSLVWRDLSYKVPTGFAWSHQFKQILRCVSGELQWHSLTAILGPSGAGKTTLLQALANQLDNHLLSGEIYLDSSSTTQSVTSVFIDQHVEQLVLPNLTVRDSLCYAFRFQNVEADKETMIEQINQITTELLLDQEVLGRSFSRCSGGEKRRIVVAQELMALNSGPKLFLLDEPTTGLDSTSALLLIQCLEQLARKRRISILLTIHQPSDQIMKFLTQIYILSCDGVTIYAGLPENLSKTITNNHEYEVENYKKPAIETFLQLACEGVANATVRQLALQFSNPNLPTTFPNLKLQNFGLQTPYSSFRLAHFATQLTRFLQVAFVSQFHILVLLLILIASVLFTTLQVFGNDMLQSRGCVNITNTSSESVCLSKVINLTSASQEHRYMFYSCFVYLLLGVLATCHGVICFSPLVKVFRHEHRNGWYSSGVFFLSYTLVSLLEVTLFSLIATLTIYFPSNHHKIDFNFNWVRLIQMATLHWFLLFYHQSQGQLFGVIFADNVQLALVIGQVLYISQAFTNGLLVTLESLHNALFAMYANFWGLCYITKAILYTVYGFQRCNSLFEYSYILKQNFINLNTVHSNLIYPLINCLAFRLATVLVLYLRFSRKSKIQLWKSSEKLRENLDKIEINEKKNLILSKKEFINNNPQCLNNWLISWRNINLSESSSWIFEEKPVGNLILRDLNGHLDEGTLTALMGPSGAGKTSLLRILTGQCSARLTGQFYLNSGKNPFLTGFIAQDVSAHLWPGLTAKQSLIYASQLKNSDQLVKHDKIVEKLLQEFGLNGIANTAVEKCSGGERRRLALAQELTNQVMPCLICLDEPTSGLDSNSALVVAKCLRKLAHKHQIAVIASVHQPTYDTLEQFDQIYCLSQNGQCLYQGSIVAEKICKFFNQLSLLKTQYPVPIEQLISFACQDDHNSCVAKLASLAKLQETQNIDLSGSHEMLNIPINTIRFQLFPILPLTHRYLHHITGHLWSQWLAYFVFFFGYAVLLRNCFDSKIALASGCVNFNENMNSVCKEMEDVLLNFRYTYVWIVSYHFVVLLQALLSFAPEVDRFASEHQNGWYTPGIFYLVKWFHEFVPLVILVPIFVAIIDIFSTAQPGIYSHVVVLLLISSTAIQAIGHSVALVTGGRLILMIFVGGACFVLLTMVGNSLQSENTLPWLLWALSQFSVLRCVQEATLSLQYGFGRCGHQETSAILHLAGIEHPEAHYYRCFVALLILLIFYRLVAYTILTHSFKNSKRTRNHRQQFQSSSNSLSLLPGLQSSEYQFRVIHYQV